LHYRLQHLHDQVRLAERGTARDGGSGAGRELRIEEIDVQADMDEAVAPARLVDDAAHQHRGTELVELAHVDNVDAARLQQVALAAIDGAHAEQMQVLRIERDARLLGDRQPGLAAQPCRRDPMQVARRRGCRGVEIRVRIEPQHEQRAPDFGAILQHAAHRVDGQPVIAAEHDRDAADQAKRLLSALRMSEELARCEQRFEIRS
jgi:hypothetical protein